MAGQGIGTVSLSGSVGILLGGLVQAAVTRYAAFQEAKGIAAAIRAELEATLSMWNHMKWDEAIEQITERLEDPRHKLTSDDVFTFIANPKPFQVFDSLCHKIGLLEILSAQVVSTYALGKAFLANVSILWDLRERLLDRKITVEREALLGLTQGVTALLQEFRGAGSQTVTALAAHERRRWLWVFF